MFRSKLEEKLGDKTENPSMVVQISETKPLSRSLQTHHLAEISKNQHSLRRAQRGKGESYTAELILRTTERYQKSQSRRRQEGDLDRRTLPLNA